MREQKLVWYTLEEKKPDDAVVVLIQLKSGMYTFAWRFFDGRWDAHEWEDYLTDSDIREWTDCAAAERAVDAKLLREFEREER